MTIERLEPADMFASHQFGFSQVVRSVGSRLIHCAGQVAWDQSCGLIGPGDFATQFREALENVARALAAAGADRSDVVSLRIYVVDYTPDYLPTIAGTLTAFFGAEQLPANTLIGVQRLALPDIMVEIEAFATLP